MAKEIKENDVMLKEQVIPNEVISDRGESWVRVREIIVKIFYVLIHAQRFTESSY